MATARKVEQVKQITEILSRSTIVIATNYRGLSVADMSQLRHRLRELGIDYRVVKNTLAYLAASNSGKPGLSSIIEGPTALAVGYGDATEPARALVDYIRSSRSALKIRGGLLNQTVLSAADVTTLARLPSRDILIANLLRAMQGTIFSLLWVLTSSHRGLVGVLKARIQQLEGG